MTAVPALRPEPIRVVIADDVADIRLLLRLQFSRDGRFHVVGEGSDGLDAIALAAELQPDLVVLDRQMPRLGGTEAIPEIRRRAPGAAIVLYTANADSRTCQAGLDAGALDVFEKGVGGGGLVDALVGSILDRVGGAHGTMEVRVGPVDSRAARVWVANTRKILDAVEAHPEELGERVPDDIFGLFRSFLDEWDAVAADTDEFRWVARAKADDVSRIVGYWATIDALTDAQLDRLGIQWSPPEGSPSSPSSRPASSRR